MNLLEKARKTRELGEGGGRESTEVNQKSLSAANSSENLTKYVKDITNGNVQKFAYELLPRVNMHFNNSYQKISGS